MKIIYLNDIRDRKSQAAQLSDNLEHIWGQILDIARQELADISFRNWFETIKPLSLEEDEIRLRVSTQFEKDIIECRYMDLLKTALRQTISKDIKIKILTTANN